MSIKTYQDHEEYIYQVFRDMAEKSGYQGYQKRIRKQKSSGNKWTQKGDVQTDKYLIECKLRSKSLTLSAGEMLNHIAHSIKASRLPIWITAFKEMGEKDQYVTMRLCDFMKLMNK